MRIYRITHKAAYTNKLGNIDSFLVTIESYILKYKNGFVHFNNGDDVVSIPNHMIIMVVETYVNESDTNIENPSHQFMDDFSKRLNSLIDKEKEK